MQFLARCELFAYIVQHRGFLLAQFVLKAIRALWAFWAQSTLSWA